MGSVGDALRGGFDAPMDLDETPLGVGVGESVSFSLESPPHEWEGDVSMSLVGGGLDHAIMCPGPHLPQMNCSN